MLPGPGVLRAGRQQGWFSRLQCAKDASGLIVIWQGIEVSIVLFIILEMKQPQTFVMKLNALIMAHFFRQRT